MVKIISTRSVENCKAILYDEICFYAIVHHWSRISRLFTIICVVLDVCWLTRSFFFHMRSGKDLCLSSFTGLRTCFEVPKILFSQVGFKRAVWSYRLLTTCVSPTPFPPTLEQKDEAKLGVGSYSMVWKGRDRRTKKEWWNPCRVGNKDWKLSFISIFEQFIENRIFKAFRIENS